MEAILMILRIHQMERYQAIGENEERKSRIKMEKSILDDLSLFQEVRNDEIKEIKSNQVEDSDEIKNQVDKKND